MISSKIDEHPVLSRQLAGGSARKPVGGRDEAHAIRQGDRRAPPPARRRGGVMSRSQASGSLPRQHERLEDAVLGHAARRTARWPGVVRAPVLGAASCSSPGRRRSSRGTRPRTGDAIAARVRACRLDGHHHRLGARVAEPDPLEARDALDQELRAARPPPASTRRTRVPRASCRLTALDERRKGVPVDQRGEVVDRVEPLDPVRVRHAAAMPLGQVERMRADVEVGLGRPAGNDLPRALEQCAGVRA